MSRIDHGSSPTDTAQRGHQHPAWKRAIADAQAEARSGTPPDQHAIVKPGDTLTAIGARYATTVDSILNANPSVGHADHIEAGQKLAIPVPADRAAPTEHVVQPGETLSGIAHAHQTTTAELIAANAIGNPDRILAGQKLAIPGGLAAAHVEQTVAVRPTTAIATAPAPTPGETARDVVAKVQVETDPDKALTALAVAYDRSDHAERVAILADAGTGQICQRAADRATQSLGANSGAAVFPQVRAAVAFERLEKVTKGLDRTLAGEVATRAVPAVDAFAHQPGTGGSFSFGARSVTSLMAIGDHIHGTPGGDAALRDLAANGIWNADSVRISIASGIDPAYAIAVGSKHGGTGPMSVAQTIADGLAEREQGKIAQGGSLAPSLDVAHRMRAAGMTPSPVLQVVADGLRSFKDKVGGDVEALAKHDAELSWLVVNDGPSLSRTQLQTAITDYRTGKGPGWQAGEAELNKRITDDGAKMIGQLAELGATGPVDAPGERSVSHALSTIVGDPSSVLAISSALQAHPELATPASAAPLVNIFSLSKVGDVGRKLLNEVGIAYVRTNVLSKFNDIDFSNPEQVALAQARVRSIDTEPMAKAFGVGRKELTAALAEVDKTMARVASEPALAKTALTELDRTLKQDSGLTKAFGKATVAGQALRGLALGFALAGTVNSVGKALAHPSDPQNDIKALVDSAGLAQKSTELLVARGFIDKASNIGGFGGEWKAAGRLSAGDLLTGLGVLLDVVSAARAFGGIGTEKDATTGALYSVSAAGGSLALAASVGEAGALAGPLGLAIAAVGIFGNLLYSSSKDAHRYEGASAEFLQAGGFDASAARALSARGSLLTGAAGAPQVPFLERYGQMRGLTPLQIQQWVNRLSPEQAHDLAARLLQTAGDSGGDPVKFSNGPPQSIYIGTWGMPVEVKLSNTLAEFEQGLAYDHVPRP